MNIDWSEYRLPAGAGGIDRATFVVWRFWRRSVRPTMGLAVRMAVPLAVGVALLLWMNGVVRFGGWAVAASIVILAAAIGVAFARAGGPRGQRLPASPIAYLVALPLAASLVGVAGIAFGLVTALVIVPVANYGLPALAVVVALGFAMVWLARRWRRREAARYPGVAGA
jgi:hypothetical protein